LWSESVPYLGLIQLIGKYVFLAGLYVFIFWIFRELFRSLKIEDSAASAPTTPARTQRPAVAIPGVQADTQRAAAASRSAPAPRPAPASRPKPCLVVRDPGGSGLTAGTEFPLSAAVTIGRAKENSVRISDRYVSTHHAMIFLKSGRRILRDRDSTNGTMRNGKRIAGEVALNNGDLVTIGTVVLEYRSNAGA